jgi:hypothetical protein
MHNHTQPRGFDSSRVCFVSALIAGLGLMISAKTLASPLPPYSPLPSHASSSSSHWEHRYLVDQCVQRASHEQCERWQQAIDNVSESSIFGDLQVPDSYVNLDCELQIDCTGASRLSNLRHDSPFEKMVMAQPFGAAPTSPTDRVADLIHPGLGRWQKSTNGAIYRLDLLNPRRCHMSQRIGICLSITIR